MSIGEGLSYLLEIEEERKERVVFRGRLAVGLAGLGSDKPVVKGDTVEKLLSYDFKRFPQTLIFPGRLHFMEVEALKIFAETPAFIAPFPGRTSCFSPSKAVTSSLNFSRTSSFEDEA